MNADRAEPVGLIGLGLLGSALSERLLQAGFDVIGFDTHPGRCEELSASGGTVAHDVEGVADECQRVLLSLPDSTIAANVLTEMRLFQETGDVVVDTTTGDPATMEQFGNDLAGQGVGYLDATIAGSSEQARRGEALIMVGGDSSHVAQCQDVLDAISPHVMHVGPCGSGARMKLVVNLVLGLNRAVLAEGLSFAKATGVDPQTALEVLKASPAYSTVMDTKGEKMLTGNFDAQARLRQHLKDVRLILQTATESDAKTPLSQWHADTLQTLVDQGHGDDDNACIIRAFD